MFNEAPTFEDMLRQWVEDKLFKAHDLDAADGPEVAATVAVDLQVQSVPVNAVVRAVREVCFAKNHDLEAYPFS